MNTRFARIVGRDVTASRVAAFLPANYQVIGDGLDDTDTPFVDIEGVDNAGWTLDDYVLPRLASGCLFGRELS